MVPIVDASRDSKVYNVNQYAGFDPYNQNIGDYTPLDKMFSMKTNDGKSVSPMDSSWGGPQYTKQKMFKQGFACMNIGGRRFKYCISRSTG